MADAEAVAEELGYPVVIRPAYTMGGTGGGLVYNVEELRTVAARGLAASLVGQVLVEDRSWDGRSWNWRWSATPRTR